MNDKPIIRHCRNCKYAELRTTGAIFCDVKYNLHEEGFQRTDAIFCRYYKQKEEEQKPTNAIEAMAKGLEDFAKNIGG